MTYTLRERCLAELGGTALLVGIGTGAIVAGAGSGGEPPWLLALAWFAAVAIPIQLFASVSGAHLNPVVTLGLFGSRKMPAHETAWFIGAQFAGAFGGSLLVLAVLGGASHLGATVPGSGGAAPIFPLEFVFTLLLVGSVLYLAERGRAPTRLELLLPAVVVGASTYLIGPWTGSSLNPARSVAPGVVSGDLVGIEIYLAATVAASLVAVGAARALRAHAAAVRREGERSNDGSGCDESGTS